MGDQVRLSVPASPAYLVLVRLMVGTIGTRLDLGIDAIEDLSLAVDELCLVLLQGATATGASLAAIVEWTAEEIYVRCHLDGPSGVPRSPDTPSNPISTQILNALTDAHGLDNNEEGVSLWLRKNREKDSPSS